MTTDELIAFILPWAKEHHRDKYDATLAVQNNENAFRKYMIRLVEIRWAEDKEFRLTVPCSILEETAISATLQDKQTGKTIVVGGKHVKGRQWGFRELATLDRKDFETLRVTKETLDLEMVD